MITLVLGGARSGKSAVAERLASATGNSVTYVATADVGNDLDLVDRIAAHRSRRPTHWVTIECGQNLIGVLTEITDVALVDSLGTWLARLPHMAADHRAFCDVLSGRSGDTIIVSDEVGLGVHPSSAEGRDFRDALGELNQAVALVADEVLFVVAGRVLKLPTSDR